jgi:hypothetical protein
MSSPRPLRKETVLRRGPGGTLAPVTTPPAQEPEAVSPAAPEAESPPTTSPPVTPTRRKDPLIRLGLAKRCGVDACEPCVAP